LEDWLSNQKSGVQKIIRDAIKNNSFPKISRKTFERKVFVKRELIPVFDNNQLRKSFPRAVSGVCWHANYIFGPYIRAMTKAIKIALKLCSRIHFTPGLNNLELGQMIASTYYSGYQHIYNGDYSSYDGSITASTLRCELDMYERIQKMNSDQKRVALAQLNTYGYTANGLYFSTPGRRNTGDPNTTLGNTLLNLISLNWLTHQFHLDCHIFCAGDDFMIMSRKPFDVESFKEMSNESFDFNLKELKYTTYLSRLTYISSRVVPATFSGESVFTCAPTYGKAIPKFFYTMSEVAHAHPIDHLSSLRAMIDASLLFDPIYQHLSNVVLRNYPSLTIQNVIERYSNYDRLRDLHLEIDPLIYQFNYERYGVAWASLFDLPTLPLGCVIITEFPAEVLRIDS
jgi:hypothetical protein